MPIVRIQNLNDPNAPFNLTTRELPEKFRLRGGELLFAWSGTPGTSFGAHIWRGGEAWLNQHIFNVLFDEKEWDKKFLQFAINQNLAEYIRAAHGGAGLAHITKGRFEESGLLQPEPNEQRRIVAEIEKQFTRLEAGVAALRRVQANLKRYRAAVLKAACEGRLVPTEAELVGRVPSRGVRAKAKGNAASGDAAYNAAPFETGEQLLQRILAERRKMWEGTPAEGSRPTTARADVVGRVPAHGVSAPSRGVRGKYKVPCEPASANLPQLPEGWTWASVDQLSSHITSGSRDWSQFYGKGSGIFILAQNVRPMRLDLSERQAVAAPERNTETERTRVRIDDLLVTIVGAKTGDVCRVPSELEDHFVCQSVALLRPVVSACAKFAEFYLASQENGQAQWKKYIYGQGRPHLSFEQLRMTPLALPPLAEQTRIVAEVERRLSVVEEMEAVVSANLQRATRLRQSILQKAFSGELA